jgi:hypothetical protein
MKMILLALFGLALCSFFILVLSKNYREAKDLLYSVRKDKMLDQVVCEYENSWKTGLMNKEIHHIAVGRISKYFELERAADDAAFKYRCMLFGAWVCFIFHVLMLLINTLDLAYLKFWGHLV